MSNSFHKAQKKKSAHGKQKQCSERCVLMFLPLLYFPVFFPPLITFTITWEMVWHLQGAKALEGEIHFWNKSFGSHKTRLLLAALNLPKTGWKTQFVSATPRLTWPASESILPPTNQFCGTSACMSIHLSACHSASHPHLLKCHGHPSRGICPRSECFWCLMNTFNQARWKQSPEIRFARWTWNTN